MRSSTSLGLLSARCRSDPRGGQSTPVVAPEPSAPCLRLARSSQPITGHSPCRKLSSAQQVVGGERLAADIRGAEWHASAQGSSKRAVCRGRQPHRSWRSFARVSAWPLGSRRNVVLACAVGRRAAMRRANCPTLLAGTNVRDQETPRISTPRDLAPTLLGARRGRPLGVKSGVLAFGLDLRPAQ
jgi:hypothetical protein